MKSYSSYQYSEETDFQIFPNTNAYYIADKKY